MKISIEGAALAALITVLTACGTMTLSRVDPGDIESIGVSVLRDSDVVEALIPDTDYRYETVFRLSGEDRVRRDPANDGVQFLTGGISDRSGQGNDYFRVPYTYALENATVELSFQRVFGEEGASSSLSWSDTYPIAWPDYVSRVYDGDEGSTPLLLLTEGERGDDGQDVTIAIAHYDAEGIPSARADRMIAVAFRPAGLRESEVRLLDHRARIEVYSRGGRGGEGRDRTTVVPRASSASPASVTGEHGGGGGRGGNGGTVQVIAADRSLFGVIGVDVSAGGGGAGGKGGQNFAKRSRIEYPNTPDARTIYSYTSVGRAAQGRSGNSGSAGSRRDSVSSVRELFNGAPRWFDRERIIDIDS